MIFHHDREKFEFSYSHPEVQIYSFKGDFCGTAELKDTTAIVEIPFGPSFTVHLFKGDFCISVTRPRLIAMGEIV